MLISFLFLHENICYEYSLEVPQRGASNEYHNICFHAEIRKLLCGYTLLSVAMESRYIFSYFSMKTYVVDTHLKLLSKALLMNTHNICFYGETRKNLSTPLDYKI